MQDISLSKSKIIPVIIKYENKKAFISDDDPNSILVKSDYLRIAIVADGFIHALIYPPNNLNYTILSTANLSDMKQYTGENQDTLNRFADHIVNKINSGYFHDYLN
jgi:hypothetical protein